MALLKSYNYTMQDMTGLADSPITKWESIRSSVPIFGMLFAYVFAVYFAVPRFMRNRKAYSLKKFIQCYNIAQVILNFLMTYNILKAGGVWSVVWRFCDLMVDNCGSNTEWQLELVWWTISLRVFDFIETVIFVLRKKDRQVSFLHVFHHITIPLSSWFVLKYFPHGYMICVAMLNSAVHTIMYSYYFLSTCGSSIQRSLHSFKKWMTVIQMIQLLFISLIPVQAFIFNCDTRIKYFSAITLCNGIMIFLLFLKFYMDSYTKLKRT